MMEPDWDVVVVGRSFAGLSAALTLGRMRRAVLVIGSGGPRNEAVHHTHNLLTRDGAGANELVRLAEGDLEKYSSIELVDARVTQIESLGEGFRVVFDGRTSTASKVVLATGVNDVPPSIPGLADHWGRGVYTCPFCDGFEHADQAVTVLGDPKYVVHTARLLNTVTDQVTVHAELDASESDTLTGLGIAVERAEVVRVVGDGDQVTAVELFNGKERPTSAVFVASMPVPNNQLAKDLQCSIDENGLVRVDEMGATDVAGVYAAGDLTSLQHQMSKAIAQGVTAGAACVASLVFGPQP